MGLDMFLFKVKKGQKPTEKNTNEVAYWRKANMIRQWFVDYTDYNVEDDCVYHKITQDDLRELMTTCVDVLAIRDDSFSAAELPTSSGFFFGDTEYNEYYYDDVASTIKQLVDVFQTTDWDEDDVYYYEWW